MKKQLLFVSAVAMSLAFASCSGEAKVEKDATAEVEEIVEDAKEEVADIKEDAAEEIEEVKTEAKKNIKKKVKETGKTVASEVKVETTTAVPTNGKSKAKAAQEASKIEPEVAPVSGRNK